MTAAPTTKGVATAAAVVFVAIVRGSLLRIFDRRCSARTALLVLGLTEACSGHGGDANVDVVGTVTFVTCPKITSLSIAPNQIGVGDSVSVGVTAAVADGGSLTFAWRAPSGAFADSAAAATTFRCAESGSVALTVTVATDGCSDTASAPIDCVAADAGPIKR